MSRLGGILLFLSLLFAILWFISLQVLATAPMPFIYALLGLSGAFLVGAIFKDLRYFLDLAQMRTTKHGLNLGVLIIIVCAILVGVNFISSRHVEKLDATKNKIFSLSEQTAKVLSSLNDDMEVKAFFVDDQASANEKQKFKDLVEWYKSKTTRLKVTFVDPMRRPDEAKANDINVSGTVVLKYKGRTSKFEEHTEQAFTNAIIKITREKNKIIYAVTGHGEHEIDQGDPDGAQSFKKYLSDASYDVKTLNFTEKAEVPADASVVLILGPKQAFFDAEIEALRKYLYSGGNLFIALDPDTKNNLGPFVKTLGVEFKNNFILDPIGQLVGQTAAIAVGAVYSPTSEMTKQMKARTLFYLASSLKTDKEKSPLLTVEEVVKSSNGSFSKKDLKNGPQKMQEGKDEAGPLTIVASISGKMREEKGKDAPKDFQAVVSGDSDFVTNRFLDSQLNQDLALNVVAFLSKDKELVSIRPKGNEASNVNITQTQVNIIWITLVFALPLLFFVTGIGFWFRRRTA